MHTLARTRSPILGQIEFVEVSGTVGSRVRDREGMDVVLEPGKTSTEITADLDAVRAGDYDVFHAELDQAAESMAEQLVGYFVETLGKVTDGTGNVVDAGGRPLSFELIYEMLDKIEPSVDDDGNLVRPTLMMHPDQADKLQQLPPLSNEQQQLLDELEQRKREEALARRRRRRLS